MFEVTTSEVVLSVVTLIEVANTFVVVKVFVT